MATVGTTTVAVKTAITSKINWIAGIGGALTAVSALCSQVTPALAFIPPPWGGYVTAGCALVTGVAVVWTRTFHTNAVLAPSVK